MKIFGLSPAAVVLSRHFPEAQVISDDGDDFATAAAVLSWPSDITANERAELTRIFEAWGWIFSASEVVSVLGLVRHADARLPSVLALDRAQPMTVVALRGWREWSGHTVSQGLVSAGFRAQAIDVQMQATSVDASHSQLQARFDDAVFRQNLVDEVRGAKQLLFPPVLGTAANVARLQDALACPVGEAVGTLPSLAGEAQLAFARGMSLLPNVRGTPGAQSLLAAAIDAKDEIVIASRRAAAWVERCTGEPPPQGSAYKQKNLHACGRAGYGVRGLGAEWLSALRLCASLGAA